MTEEYSASEEFLAHVDPATTQCWAELSNLGEALDELFDAGRGAWPGVDAPKAAFVRYLAERPPNAHTVAEALQHFDATELYLTCACALGDPLAIAAFERTYLVEVDRALASSRLPISMNEDVRQTVMLRLLVATDDGRPRLDEYAGRGDLRGLVRVVARRAAISLLRKTGREVAVTDDDLLCLVGDVPDPELECIKAEHRAAVRSALQTALGGLEPRARNILRLHLLDRLTVQQIASSYGVHRTTATRWMTSARSDVLAVTRRALRERLGDCDQIGLVSLVTSRLDLSLERILSSTTTAARPKSPNESHEQ